MSTTEQLLEAGALLPVKQKLKTTDPVDDISARAYSHPALEKPIVRLCADKLAQGDDLAMDFLGFEKPTVTGPVCKRRRQALGFPGWALIHDPKHARYALELVKAMKKAARRAKSKPGHSYDEFVDTSKKLGRSVAHFLPSYWEEVGRIFMEVGGTTFASRAFNKAREAEKVHALKVDENIRRDAFLEFALAGCLSIKTLSEYGRELQKTQKPLQAWEFFRELCIRRTMGGMPPYASIRKDLDRLLKDTKLNKEQEHENFLEEIIDSPALVRATEKFWESYEDTARNLAKKNAHVAGALLNMIPDWGYWSQAVWPWTKFLDQIGILTNAWEKDVHPDAAPTGGAAAWFNTRLKRYQPPVDAFQLLDRMADRLRADKTPVDLRADDEIDIDLLDIALESKIPVQDPDKNTTLNLNHWAQDVDEMPERPRDPLFVHKDKRFAPLLAAAVPDAAGSIHFEKCAAGKQALKTARREWLTKLIDSIDTCAIPYAEDQISVTENRTFKSSYREFPEPYKTLKTIRIAPSLARNLREGLLDEYGWPALEQAVEKLQPDPKAKNAPDLNVVGCLPHIIVQCGANVIVVDRDGIVLEQEIPLAKSHRVTGIAWIEGRLAVETNNTKTYESATFWADEPKKRFKESSLPNSLGGIRVKLPGGGVFGGSKAISATDSAPDYRSEPYFFDGNTVWKTTYEYGERDWRTYEVNPVDGKTGRNSLPAFLEDFVGTGDSLQFGQCQYLQAGDYLNHSPLGAKDGAIGWRVKQTSKKNVIAEGIDGRRWEGDSQKTPIGLLDLPGAKGQYIPVTGNYWSSGYYYNQPDLWNAEFSYRIDDGSLTSDGQAVKLPVIHWHMFQVRDIKTSEQLRKVTDADAEKLISAAQLDLEQKKVKGKPREFPQTISALKKRFPKLKDERLTRGLVHVVQSAASLQNRISKVIVKTDPDTQDLVRVDESIEALATPAFRQLGMYWHNRQSRIFGHIKMLGLFFSGKLPEGQGLPQVSEDWLDVFNGLTSRIWNAILNPADAGANAFAWTHLVEAWLDESLVSMPGKFRVIDGNFDYGKPLPFPDPDDDDDDEEDDNEKACPIFESNGNTYIFYTSYGRYGALLEYAPPGKKLHVPKHFDSNQHWLVETDVPTDDLRKFVIAARENGVPEVQREQLEQLAADIDVDFAEAALLWYPSISKEKRKEFKLKVKEIEAAEKSRRQLAPEFRSKLLMALFADDPTRVWTDVEQALANVATTWKKNAPKRLPLSGAMINRVPAGKHALSAMADPKSSDLFSKKAKYTVDASEGLTITCKPESATLPASLLSTITQTMLFIVNELPVGDPARSAMPDVIQGITQALSNPTLLMDCGSVYEWNDKIDFREKLKAIFKTTKLDKKSKILMGDDGTVVGVAQQHHAEFAYRPAKTKNAADIARVKNSVESIGATWENSLTVVELLQSKALQAIADRIVKTPVPVGQYEANPAHSCPQLLEKAAKTLKLSDEAATLYLQVLALPEPTVNNIKLWNDWKPAAIKKTVAELVKSKLLLEAKRSRAGRTYFLPGGWEPLDSPHLPLETWKLPLYGITRSADGHMHRPLGRILCLQPLHEMFAAALQRITDGDEPGYEEVK